MGRPRGEPIDTYLEWIEHRYDPGYYLGGRIPPHLRTSALGPRARRLSGWMLMTMGGAGLLTVVAARGAAGLWNWIAAESVMSLLVLAAGIAMYRGSRTTDPPTRTGADRSRRSERRRRAASGGRA